MVGGFAVAHPHREAVWVASRCGWASHGYFVLGRVSGIAGGGRLRVLRALWGKVDNLEGRPDAMDNAAVRDTGHIRVNERR